MQFPQQGLQLPWNSPEYKEQMRKKRNASLQRYRTHAIVLGILTLASLVIGGVTIYYGTQGRGATMYVGGPLIPGGFGVVCCTIAYFLYQSGKAEESNSDPSGKTKCLFIMHYVFHLLLVITCANLLTPIILALAFCNGDDTCDNKTAILVICILGIVTCVVMTGWTIVALVYYCYYVRAYGFKDRNQRLIELQLYMQSQQQGQLAPGYGLGQQYAPLGGPGYTAPNYNSYATQPNTGFTSGRL